MTIFRFSLAAISAVMLFGCTTMHIGDSDVEAVAKSYCAAIIANDEAKAEMLLSDSLLLAITKARETNRLFEAAHPGDKPPLGDGLPLTGYPDRPSTCTPTDIRDGSVTLRYELAYAPEAGWQDKLIFETSTGRTKIADVLFGPEHKHSLSQALVTIANEGAPAI